MTSCPRHNQGLAHLLAPDQNSEWCRVFPLPWPLLILAPGPGGDWICNNEQLICLLSARPLPSLAWAHSVVFNKTNGESIGHNDNDIASRQPTRTRHHSHSFSKLSLCLRTRFIYCLGLFWFFIRGRKFYLKCASLSSATFGRNQNTADTVLPYTANEYLRRTIMYICK